MSEKVFQIGVLVLLGIIAGANVYRIVETKQLANPPKP